MIRGVSPSAQDKWLARKATVAPSVIAPQKIIPTPIIRLEGLAPDPLRIIASSLYRRLRFANRRQIIDYITFKHSVTYKELRSPTREARVAHPRQEAFFLLRKDLNLSLNQIGKLFGGRDHTTVLFGIKAYLRRKASGCKRKRRPVGVKYTTVRPKSTHCTNGHLLDAANTRIDHRGYRRCRMCCKSYNRFYRTRQKEQSLNRGLGM